MAIDRNLSQTFARGLEVLKLLNERNGATAGQIARKAALNEVVVRRLLDTLVSQDIAIKSVASGQYWLTAHAASLSSGYAEDRWIMEIAQPAMNRLGHDVVWPVSLVTPSGPSLVVRTNTDHDSPLTLRKSPIGERYPLSESASGPVYLAFCDGKERDSLVALLWSTERRNVRSQFQSKAGMLASLVTIRRRGYAIFNGPERVSALAVPVLRDGRAAAALSLRYFTSAMTGREAVRRYFPLLRRCADAIGQGISAATEGTAA
jgi:IclR family mhp operon transcriptional activator